MTRHIIGCAVPVFLVLLSCLGNVSAATVRGRVVDDGKKPPDNGIPGVDIQLTLKDGSKRRTVTANDGTWHVDGVAAEIVSISFLKARYVRHPTTRQNLPIVDDPTLIGDVTMWQIDEGYAYWETVALHMFRRTQRSDQPQIQAGIEWQRLKEARLPPFDRWSIAQAAQREHPELLEMVPAMAAYCESDKEQLRQTHSIVHGALRTGDDVQPAIASLREVNVNQVVLGDVIEYQLRGPMLDPARRHWFLNGMRRDLQRDAVTQRLDKTFADYRGVEEKAIVEAQRMIHSVVWEGANDQLEPTKLDAMNVKGAVLRDVIGYELLKQNLPHEKRDAFLDYFEENWRDRSVICELHEYPIPRGAG